MRKSSIVPLAAVCAIAFFSVRWSRAEIRVPKMISDHAVLQREAPIRIWGWATPGAKITVQFHAQKLAAEVDSIGEWVVWLMPEQAGGPYRLHLEGDGTEGTIDVADVMVGDVWFASGQSNMEMPLKGFPPVAKVQDADHEIAMAQHPELRLLMIDHKSSNYPLAETGYTWTQCTPESAAGFSAVAYFFGRDVAAHEHVTVGLIDATWGGTPADSWVSLEMLGSDPLLLPAFASRASFAGKQANLNAQFAAEKRMDEAAKSAGKPAPTHPWHPSEESWLPAGLYNGMIAPATKYSIKGFLWYQGETNSGPDRAPYYATLFPALITDWRKQFGQGDLPFLFVQLSSFRSPGEDWGTIRDAQRRTLALRNTAMAVSLDVGDANNVHPADKQTVGARLALAARGMVYGEPVEYISPLFRQATTEPGGMRVWFDHADGLSTRGKPLQGFELAGTDGRFFAAKAVIAGDSVVVTSEQVAAPRSVRYAWSNVAPPGMFNRAGLPASTFTSEENRGR